LLGTGQMDTFALHLLVWNALNLNVELLRRM